MNSPLDCRHGGTTAHEMGAAYRRRPGRGSGIRPGMAWHRHRHRPAATRPAVEGLAGGGMDHRQQAAQDLQVVGFVVWPQIAGDDRS